MSKIRPLHDRVVVQREEDNTTSAGGIVIPDNAKEKPARGKVWAVGQGKRLDNGDFCACDVKKGDIVLFGKYAGTEVSIDNKDYIVMREDDILAIID